MIKNPQRPVPPIKDHDGLTLQVHSVFRTIQGEGPFRGHPAVFVRLANCNLQCPLCLTGDTPITMWDGSTKPFRQIVVNDAVEAFNFQAQRAEPRNVQRVMARYAERIVEISTERGIIRATPEHQFLVFNQQSKPRMFDVNAGYIEAWDLHVGDKLQGGGTEPLWFEVRKVEIKNERVLVYSMSVKGLRNFTAGGVVVHNCDTEYTEGTYEVGFEELVAQIADTGRPGDIVVITGGEPFRQNLNHLCASLELNEFEHIQIETNGMLKPPGWDALRNMPRVHVVCSPKTHKVHPEVINRVDSWKYVVDRRGLASDDFLPIMALDHPVPPGQRLARPPAEYDGLVYVQPADEDDEYANAKNMDAAVKAVLKEPGRVLNLQIHKYAGLD